MNCFFVGTHNRSVWLSLQLYKAFPDQLACPFSHLSPMDFYNGFFHESIRSNICARSLLLSIYLSFLSLSLARFLALSLSRSRSFSRSRSLSRSLALSLALSLSRSLSAGGTLGGLDSSPFHRYTILYRDSPHKYEGGVSDSEQNVTCIAHIIAQHFWCSSTCPYHSAIAPAKNQQSISTHE